MSQEEVPGPIDRPITIGIMLRHMEEKGGIQVYSRNMVQHLLRADKINRYVFLTPTPLIQEYGLEQSNVSEVIVRWPSLLKRLSWDQHEILRHIERNKIDLVFNPKLSVPVFTKKKTVFTMHGMEQFAARHLFKRGDRMYYQVAMKFYCRKASAILVMTPTGKTDLIRYLKAPEEKIHVIPESYNELCALIEDRQVLEKVKQKYQLPEKYILFVGGITPLKNIPALLKAFKILKSKGYPHRLVLVGFKRWKFNKDLALISSLGLEKEVMELGFVDDLDIPAIYNLAECFVLPSFYEGFGLPILEAQACGCPVIISNRGGMPDVAGEGGALRFEPDQPEELALRLEEILGNEGLKERLRSNGLKNVKRFSWETTAKKTIEVFKMICRDE